MKSECKNRNTFTAVAVIVVAAILLAMDQIIKYFVLTKLKPMGTVTVIPGLLEFTYVENIMWLVVPITVAATVAIAVLLFRYKRHTFFSYATSALLIAGGIGNLIDRIAYGFVVDFIHVLFFDYIFNFADCCITVGAVLFVIHVLFFTRSEEDTKGKEEPCGDHLCGRTWPAGRQASFRCFGGHDTFRSAELDRKRVCHLPREASYKKRQT